MSAITIKTTVRERTRLFALADPGDEITVTVDTDKGEVALSVAPGAVPPPFEDPFKGLDLDPEPEPPMKLLPVPKPVPRMVIKPAPAEADAVPSGKRPYKHELVMSGWRRTKHVHVPWAPAKERTVEVIRAIRLLVDCQELTQGIGTVVQIEELTGVPRSTLRDVLSRAYDARLFYSKTIPGHGAFLFWWGNVEAIDHFLERGVIKKKFA